MQQRKENTEAGKPVPAELLARSRVLALLWLHRGRHDGLSMAELCTRLGRDPRMVAAQLRIARNALRRAAPRWRIEEEWVEQRASISEPRFWLTAPHCPRPPRIVAREGVEPEIVSLEDLREDFIGDMPRWSEM